MNKEECPDKENLLEAIRQNWLHARHLETERLWFTNIYAIVVAGSLAFLGQFDIGKYPYLIMFLFIFSLLGLLVTLKVNHEYGNEMQALKKTLDHINMNNYFCYPTAYGKGFSIWKIIRVRYAFVGFYIATMLMWVYLFLSV
jgi:hypothetical protein